MELCVPAGTLSDLNITGPEFLHWMPVVQDQRNRWYYYENCPGNSVRYDYRLCVL